MLDIKFIRENQELVKENMRNKFRSDTDIVDKVLIIDETHRELSAASQKLRAKRNTLSQSINEVKKSGGDIKPILEEVAAIPQQIAEFDDKLTRLGSELDSLLKKIPVIMHPSVPKGKDESENVEVARYGTITQQEVLSHQDIAKKLGLADFDSSATTSGTGFYYLEGSLALLNQALLRYAIDTMVSRGFRYVETPYMLRHDVIEHVVSLSDQENQIYKIEGEDLYLIGTSEHSLIGRFIEKTLPESQLPLKQTSYSMCFRKEKGSHGLDERGLYRTHQFNKIEMIVICKPEDSMKHYQEMKQITIDIFTGLGIPIRELAICSGDLGDMKHVQVDIEAYSPRRKGYFEVGSCSNLVDAQARGLRIRVEGKQKYFPHTLNNTALATSRALVAILENNQDAQGRVKIPPVLVPYMQGKEYLS